MQNSPGLESEAVIPIFFERKSIDLYRSLFAVIIDTSQFLVMPDGHQQGRSIERRHCISRYTL